MGILDFTGFESGVLDELASYSGLVSFDTTSERTGTYCLKIDPQSFVGGDSYAALGGLVTASAVNEVSNGLLDKTFGFSCPDTYVRFYVRIGTMPANTEPIFTLTQVGSMSAYKMQLLLTSSGQIIWTKSDGTTVVTMSLGLTSGTWYSFGVYCGTGTSVPYRFQLNGADQSVGTYSESGSVGQSGYVVLGIKDPSVTPTGTYYYDDVAISDSGMPGAGGSYVQFATANGTYTGYTASSGTKFGAVSTIPYSTGTYISTATGAAYTATFQSYAGTGTPATVKTFAVAADPANGGGNFSTRLRFGTTDDDTTPNALSTSPTVFQRLYQVNLNGSRWTTVDFNALESGVVSTGAARAYAIYLLADNSTISAHAYQPSGRMSFSGLSTIRATYPYATTVGRLSVSGLGGLTVTTSVQPTGRLSVNGIASPTTGQVVVPVGKLALTGTLPGTTGGTGTFMYSPSGRLNLIPDRQLVGWYTFYDQQGSRLTDSTLYQDHGTLVGMSDSNWLSTINGYGLTFNGSGQYVSFSTLNVDTSTSGAAAVVAFWMYWQGSSNQSVFTIGNSLCVTSTGIGWSNSGGSTDLYGVATTGLANTWVHVIAVFRNSTTNYRLYLNGVQQTLSALVGSTTGSSLSATAYLGGNGSIFNTFTGVFAGLKIYNRDVTAADVAELAANGFAVKLDESAIVRTGQLHYPLGPITMSGVSGTPGSVKYVYLGAGLLTFQDPTLLLWLRLEEGTGTTTVYDSSIYGRIGSMNNMENGDWVAGVPTIRYLYGSNYALQFDGVNEYLQVSSAGLTNPEYTIVLWVNPGALPDVEQYSSGSEGQGDPGQGMAGPLVADPPVLAEWQPV